MIYVIGCGGGGSHTAQILNKLKMSEQIKDTVLLMDGDTFEEKNLDRQFFDADQVGVNKAEALYRTLDRIGYFIPEYFHSGHDITQKITPNDWIFCEADNHPCKMEVLKTCDSKDSRAIISGNEYLEAEAYFYDPSFKGTANDPRIFYPEITTSKDGDPLGPPGCVEMYAARPQLVLANVMATDLAMHLWWFYCFEASKLPYDTRAFWPVHHKANSLKLQTIRYGDRS